MAAKKRYILQWAMTPKALRRLADWFHAHAERYERYSLKHRLMEDICVHLHALAKEIKDEHDHERARREPPHWLDEDLDAEAQKRKMAQAEPKKKKRNGPDRTHDRPGRRPRGPWT